MDLLSTRLFVGAQPSPGAKTALRTFAMVIEDPRESSPEAQGKYRKTESAHQKAGYGLFVLKAKMLVNSQ
jgi:hypothetical protein